MVAILSYRHTLICRCFGRMLDGLGLSLMKTKTEPKPKNLKTGVQLHDLHLKVFPWTTARALLRSNAVKTEKDTEFTPNPAQA